MRFLFLLGLTLSFLLFGAPDNGCQAVGRLGANPAVAQTLNRLLAEEGRNADLYHRYLAPEKLLSSAAMPWVLDWKFFHTSFGVTPEKEGFQKLTEALRTPRDLAVALFDKLKSTFDTSVLAADPTDTIEKARSRVAEIEARAREVGVSTREFLRIASLVQEISANPRAEKELIEYLTRLLPEYAPILAKRALAKAYFRGVTTWTPLTVNLNSLKPQVENRMVAAVGVGFVSGVLGLMAAGVSDMQPDGTSAALILGGAAIGGAMGAFPEIVAYPARLVKNSWRRVSALFSEWRLRSRWRGKKADAHLKAIVDHFAAAQGKTETMEKGVAQDEPYQSRQFDFKPIAFDPKTITEQEILSVGAEVEQEADDLGIRLALRMENALEPKHWEVLHTANQKVLSGQEKRQRPKRSEVLKMLNPPLKARIEALTSQLQEMERLKVDADQLEKALSANPLLKVDPESVPEPNEVKLSAIMNRAEQIKSQLDILRPAILSLSGTRETLASQLNYLQAVQRSLGIPSGPTNAYLSESSLRQLKTLGEMVTAMKDGRPLPSLEIVDLTPAPAKAKELTKEKTRTNVRSQEGEK